MTNKPAWIDRYNSPNGAFSVVTGDSSLDGEVRWYRWATTDDDSPPNTIYDTYSMTFEYECAVDTLVATNSGEGNGDFDVIFGSSAQSFVSSI